MNMMGATRRIHSRFRQTSAPHSVRRRSAKAIGGAASALALLLIGFGAWSAYHHEPITVTVKRADLIVSLCQPGILESADRVDVKNRVRGRASILHIVPDGSYVHRGDLLARLDDTWLREALAIERASLAKTEAMVIRSQRNLQAASVAVDEYGEGVYAQQRLQLQKGILEAQRSLAKTKQSLLRVRLMYHKAFVSQPHVKQMQLAVEKAESDLAAAKLKKEVLEEFTQAKVLAELASTRDIWVARLRAEGSVVREQTAKIARLEEDLRNCEIRGPRDGMVVYADRPASVDRQASPIYEGAWVRQFQTLVCLANLAQMQVRVLAPQTALSQVRRGQRASIRVLDQTLYGKVASVADRPEPTPPDGEEIKQFAVVIALDSGGERLKPGLTAEAEILIDHRNDALVIPLMCVVDSPGKSYIWVANWGRMTRREVVLGLANDSLVEVIGGLDEGDEVILNPQQ